MSNQIKIWIHGLSGRMGQEIHALIDGSDDLCFTGGSDIKISTGGELAGKPTTPQNLSEAIKAEMPHVILDFSTKEANQILLEALKIGEALGACVLLGTTGLDQKALASWKHLFKGASSFEDSALLFAPNTSLGITLALRSALSIAGVLSDNNYDIEIVETHHRNKVDAPSGTAKFLASALVKKVKGLHISSSRGGARKENEIGVHAVRGGSIFGEHEIRFLGDHEELTISHRALDRRLFAKGALTLTRWLSNKHGVYGLKDVEF